MILLTYAMPEEEPRCEIPAGCRTVVTGIGKVLAVTQTAKAVCAALAEILAGALSGERVTSFPQFPHPHCAGR